MPLASSISGASAARAATSLLQNSSKIVLDARARDHQDTTSRARTRRLQTTSRPHSTFDLPCTTGAIAHHGASELVRSRIHALTREGHSEHAACAAVTWQDRRAWHDGGVSDVEWQRFVLDIEGDRDEDLEDHHEVATAFVTRQGTTVYVRVERDGKAPKIEIRQLEGEASAERAFAARVAKLRAAGYLADGVARAPLPERDDRAAARAETRTDGDAVFEAGIPRFVEAWRARGYDPCLRFVDQARRKRVDVRRLVEQCFADVVAAFGRGVSGHTRTYADDRLQIIPRHDLARFYERPARVLALVREKLRGKHEAHDDDEPYGLADELEVRMRVYDDGNART